MAEEMVPKAIVDMQLQRIAVLQNTVNSLQSTVFSLQETVEKLNAIIENKNQIILNIQRNTFGQRSEKSCYVLSEGQTSLFEFAGNGSIEQSAAANSSPETKTVLVPAHTRKPKRKLGEMTANLHVEEVICELPEEERYNEQGEPLKPIGKEFVRTEICREPAKVFVKNYYVTTYVDPRAEKETGYASIIKATAPAPLLPHSYVSASVATDIMIRKYADGLPLKRQEDCWKREFNVDLNRGTMANWMV